MAWTTKHARLPALKHAHMCAGAHAVIWKVFHQRRNAVWRLCDRALLKIDDSHSHYMQRLVAASARRVACEPAHRHAGSHVHMLTSVLNRSRMNMEDEQGAVGSEGLLVNVRLRHRGFAIITTARRNAHSRIT